MFITRTWVLDSPHRTQVLVMLPFLIAVALQVAALQPTSAHLLPPVSPAAARGAEMTAGSPRATGRRSPCVVRHSTEARYRAYGYDHIVHLKNDCRRNAVCSISTDVSPTTLEARVNAGRHIEVLTFRGSPSRVFRAAVACRLGE